MAWNKLPLPLSWQTIHLELMAMITMTFSKPQQYVLFPQCTMQYELKEFVTFGLINSISYYSRSQMVEATWSNFHITAAKTQRNLIPKTFIGITRNRLALKTQFAELFVKVILCWSSVSFFIFHTMWMLTNIPTRCGQMFHFLWSEMNQCLEM